MARPVDDWTLLRNYVLLRDGGCLGYGVPCHRVDTRARCWGRIDPHHLWRRGQGGPDAAENLIALARSCHSYVHDNPLVAQCLGLLVPAWTAMAGVAMTSELRTRARHGIPAFAPWLTDAERADVWRQLPAVTTSPLSAPFIPVGGIRECPMIELDDRDPDTEETQR